MNKRIRELAEQAELKYHNWITGESTVIDGDFKYPRVEDFEKFAELIVRMCADYADMAQDAGCEYAGDYVAEAMGYGEEEGVTEWRAK